MAFCNTCGRQNPDDAKFCSQCASPIVAGQQPQTGAPPPAAPPQPSPPPPASERVAAAGERFGKEMGGAGERFGQGMERLGERLGKDFEVFGAGWNDWYSRTLGVLAPLLGALCGLVVLVLAIAAVDHFELHNVSDFLLRNIVVLFILMIVLGYASYAQKKFRKKTRITEPVVTAVGLAVALWVLSELSHALWLDTNLPGLETVSLVFRVMIFVALVLVIVVGYFFIFVVLPRERAGPQPPTG